MTVSRYLLLTGSPGVGKTTVLREVARRLPAWRLGGFLTEEIRSREGRRQGFLAVTFTGEKWTIAHVGHVGTARVGRYGVDLAGVDRLAAVIDYALDEALDAVLVDEIGKMECHSSRFVDAVRRLLDSGVPAVATVAQRGSGFIAEVKSRSDVEIWQVTSANRDRLVDRVVTWMRSRRP